MLNLGLSMDQADFNSEDFWVEIIFAIATEFSLLRIT
jgi:hypothetical protein